LQATALDGSVLRFAIPVANVKDVIAFLLGLVGTSARGGPTPVTAPGSALIRFRQPGSPLGPRAAPRDISAFRSAARNSSFPCRCRHSGP
jgi:hypothetical protein